MRLTTQQSTSCRTEDECKYGNDEHGKQLWWRMTTVADDDERVIGRQTAMGKDESGR
jgi:hypothetical protein